MKASVATAAAMLLVVLLATPDSASAICGLGTRAGTKFKSLCLVAVRDFLSDPNQTITTDALRLLSGSRARKLDNLESDPPEEDARPLQARTGPLPDSFDNHEFSPECKPAIRDQGSCGSCWTFSTAGVMAQRMCILNPKVDKTLIEGPQGTLSCDESCHSTNVCQGGCQGGYPELAFQNMIKDGVYMETCVEYEGSDSIQCQEVKTETNACSTGPSNPTKFFAESAYYLSNEAKMKEDIYYNGPIQATFMVYKDIYGYREGVYDCDTNDSDEGAHSVIVVGYGTEDGVDYWRVQNSWGAGWGDDGYIKIKRGGSNNCKIETWASAGLPKTENFAFQNGKGVSGAAPTTSFSLAAAALPLLLALLKL